MTQRTQIIKALELLGGYATLRDIYQRVNASDWRAVDWQASIRRNLQESQEFIKIKPGLWGLDAQQNKFAHLMDKQLPQEEQDQRDHYYYQGLLLEIGNARNFDTFVPNQDRGRTYLRTTLGQTRSLREIYQFGYPEMVYRASRIDVIWFNERKMPYAAFEVEHSTNFTSSLSKCIALQDFAIRFYMVADKSKRQQFAGIFARDEYRPLCKRVKFLDYEELANWHSHSMQIQQFADLP